MSEGASIINVSAVLVVLSAHVPHWSLGLCVMLRTYAPPLLSPLGCWIHPNHHDVNHQNGLKTKEVESSARLQGFIPNGAFIGALHPNQDGNSHRYTDWSSVIMRCFAVN